MKITKYILISLFFFSSSAFASGVLIDAKGQVTITMADGKNIAAKTGVELPDGTKVSTGPKAAASVMMMDGSIQEIGSGQNYLIGEPPKSQGQQTVIGGIALAMNEATAMGDGPTVHGMVKMAQMGPGAASKPRLASMGNRMGPQGVFPVETTIDKQTEITFRWGEGSKIDFPNPVILIADAAKKIVFAKKISPSRPFITIKSDEFEFIAGNSYSWYLATDEKGKILGRSRRFNFAILSAADKLNLENDKAKIQELKISDDGKKFLTAQVYYRARLYDNMVNELLPLWKKDRSDAVKKLLYLGYVRMGQAEDAMKYQ